MSVIYHRLILHYRQTDVWDKVITKMEDLTMEKRNDDNVLDNISESGEVCIVLILSLREFENLEFFSTRIHGRNRRKRNDKVIRRIKKYPLHLII